MGDAMRIGVYPFASTGLIGDNLRTICKAIRLAAEAGARLLVFHECALCGYPPLETGMHEIAEHDIEAALNSVSACARSHGVFVAVGTVRFSGAQCYNSMVVFDDRGERLGCYDKQALWGWDVDHFTPGGQPGIFEIDGMRIGFRICFDIRFPELFRQLYRHRTDLCFVSFSDTNETPMPERYATIKAHLVTRSVENVMTVVSVNSLSRVPTAPTAVFDCNGMVVKEAAPGRETLLLYDYAKPEMTFGMEGRIVNSHAFLGLAEPDAAKDAGTMA